MKAKLFINLEERESVTFEELSASLELYASDGWSVDSRVVKKIVDKVDPSIDELDKLIASALKGLEKQTQRREVEAVGEYQDLLYYLQEKSFTRMGL